MNPLLTETPVVTIKGVSQNLPRLTLSAALKLPKLLNKLLTDDVLEIFSNVEDEQSAQERGISIISALLEGLDGAEETIYEILSLALSLERKEVESIPLAELGEIIVAYKGHPDIDFFTKTLKNLLTTQK